MALHSFLLLLLTFLVTQSVGKVSRCREVLNKHTKDFFYCTKFTAGKGQAFKAYYSAKWTRNMKHLAMANAKDDFKDATNIQVTIAIYKFEDWQTLIALQDPTCKQKEDLAFQLSRPRIPIDGTERNDFVTRTERNWYHPQMYIMAVMDCHSQVDSVLGPNRYGKLSVLATMTSDDDHFSYEQQGALTTDMVLMVCYITLFALSMRDLLKFIDRNDTRNSPHVYCLIAMGF